MNLYHKNLADNQITANSTLIEVLSFQTSLASIDFSKLFQQYKQSSKAVNGYTRNLAFWGHLAGKDTYLGSMPNGDECFASLQQLNGT